MKKSELFRLTQALQTQYDLPVQNVSNRKLQELLRKSGLVKENPYQELEMDAPFVEAQQDISYTADEVQLHSHFFYELICCRSGNVQYLIGAKRYRLQRGDIIFLPPKISHRPLFLEQLIEPYDREVIWVSAAFIDRIKTTFFPQDHPEMGPYLLRTAGTQWEGLTQFFRQTVEEAERQELGWQAACCALTAQLLVQLLRAMRDITPPPTERRELLDEIMLYIETHMAEKLSLEGTARQFLVSESTISQLFRSRLNVSFYRFVTQRRLIAAKTRIQAGEPMEQIAQAIGFGDYSNFYRAFKQEYGITPTQFRQRQCQPSSPAPGAH